MRTGVQKQARRLMLLAIAFGLGAWVVWGVFFKTKPVDVAGMEARRDVPALIQALRRGDWTRTQAARALGRLGDERAVVPLIKAIGEPRESEDVSAADARIAVVLALGKLQDGRAVAPLMRLVADPDLYLWERSPVVHALAQLGDPRSVRVVLETDRLDDVVVRDLVLMGPVAVPRLVGVLSGTVSVPARRRAEITMCAATALGRTGQASAVARATTALLPGLGVDGENAWRTRSDLIALVNRKHPETLGRLLARAKTVRAYWGAIRLGDLRVKPALVRALRAYGDSDMAEDYENSGNEGLSAAASEWATAHGYVFITPLPTITPGGSGAESAPKTGWGALS